MDKIVRTVNKRSIDSYFLFAMCFKKHFQHFKVNSFTVYFESMVSSKCFFILAIKAHLAFAK